MKITITGSPKEIAALAMELQERQKATDKSNKKNNAVKPVRLDLGEVLLRDLESIRSKT